MSNSAADLEGPQGDPDGISRAAGDLSRQSAGFWDTSQQLRSLPGSLTTWQGPASVAFAGTALAYADDAAAASDALSLVARVTQAFANELADAQAADRRARAERGRALQDIARANADIAKAQARASAAQAADGVPGAELIVRAALADKERAKRALKRAEDELKQAIADIREAEQRASRATSGLQQALQADIGFRGPGSLPPLTPLSGLAPPTDWNAISMFFSASSGALGAFSSRNQKRAKADVAQARRKARSWGGYDPDRPPDLDREVTKQKRAAIKQLEGSKARIPQLKAISRVGKLAGLAAIPLQYAANSGKMSRTENLTRTGFSAAFSTAGGAAGVVCGPAAPLCGAGFAVGAGIAGDKVGGVAYDEGRRFVGNLRFWGNRR